MLCAYHRDSIPSGLHVHIDIGNLGCPFDAHWVPRWFPFGYTLGTLDFQLGSIAMPMGPPCHSHMGSHWSSIGSPWHSHGGTHCMPMRSPWGPQWDPLGFPCGPIGAFHAMHMWCQFASWLVSLSKVFCRDRVFDNKSGGQRSRAVWRCSTRHALLGHAHWFNSTRHGFSVASTFNGPCNQTDNSAFL